MFKHIISKPKQTFKYSTAGVVCVVAQLWYLGSLTILDRLHVVLPVKILTRITAARKWSSNSN